MVDTFTKFLNLTKPEVGASRDTWGAKQNDNLDKTDTWAETIDALAKGALSRTVTTLQEVASPLRLKETVEAVKSVTFLAGYTVPAGFRANFGNGSIIGESARLSVGAVGGVFEVLNEARTASLAKITGTDITLANNKRVFTDNNLDPNIFADKTAVTLQSFVGDMELQKTNPSFWLFYPNVKRARWTLDSNGRLTWRDGTGQDHFRIEADGKVWTQEFGDLASRINNVANDAASGALTTATTRINRKTLRFTFAGDLGGNWNANGPMTEPYNGAVITSRTTTFANNIYFWGDARWRYLQMSDSNGNFYSIGY